MVAHLLAVTVIRGNQALSVRGEKRSLDPTQALIQCFDRGHRRIKLTGVSHHVAVGKINDDKVVAACLNRIDQRIRDLVRAHLRLQVVGCHVG